jgi:5'-nucleotidase
MTRLTAGVLALACVSAAPAQPARVTLSIVGTSDLHGVTAATGRSGGLTMLAGYVNNLRAARAADGGAVLLLDSGDTFQGDVESNLSEGAVVVDAYNAMGYAAAAVGNHDFDFGAVDSAAARQLPGDPRGALKARAAQAHYPFLAANLIDETTGRAVEWPNVRPSVLVEAAGIKVGIVGVMTTDALQSTLAGNVQGLRIAPLGSSIAMEAARLRAAGAAVVVVAAHAGGRCERFDAAEDLSSCDADTEIFRVARGLPPGLVDAIAAGHTHFGLAHVVNGVGIIQPFSRGQSFGRIDLVFDRRTGRVQRVQPFAPHPIEAGDYEGRTVTRDPAIIRAMAPALQRVHALQATPLGVSLEAPILRAGDGGSPIGNLFAEALRAAVPGADVAAVNNAARGLRADLPAGPLTLGRLYDVFPFDNLIAHTTLTGAELAQWIAGEIQQGRRDGLGISGVEVRTSCRSDGLHVDLFRGVARIEDDEPLLAVAIGAPTPSGGLASPAFLGGVGPIGNAPVVREVVEDWFRRHGPSYRYPVAVEPPPVDCLVR